VEGLKGGRWNGGRWKGVMGVIMERCRGEMVEWWNGDDQL